MSHHVVQPKPADDPAFSLPEPLAKLALPICIGGLVVLVAGVFLGSSAHGTRFGLSAYLTAFIYCLTLAVGSLFFVLIQHLVRAGWSVVVRRIAELMMIMIVPLAVLFIPILFAAWNGSLYAWSFPDYQAEEGVPSKIWDEKARWLNPTWFTIRSAIYWVVYLGLATWYFRNSRLQDQTGEIKLTESMQARSGPAVIAFAFCTSFAAFDWVMSLAPMWFSTMFGVYMFVGGVLSAHCAIALLSFIYQKMGALRDEVTVEHYHDLGKLMFGFICFWAYIAFSQYMLIWYANIPEETHWYSIRGGNFDFTSSTANWSRLGIILMIAHFGIPFVGIMSRHVRRRPWAVACWAAYILVLHFIDLYWVIMPELGIGMGGLIGILSSVLCWIGLLALMFGLMLRLSATARLVPVRDPRLVESLSFVNI